LKETCAGTCTVSSFWLYFNLIYVPERGVFMGLKDVFADFEGFEADVAEELQSQRRRANIALKDMAEKIGLHSNTIAKCERHEIGIGLEIIFGYAFEDLWVKILP